MARPKKAKYTEEEEDLVDFEPAAEQEEEEVNNKESKGYVIWITKIFDKKL